MSTPAAARRLAGLRYAFGPPAPEGGAVPELPDRLAQGLSRAGLALPAWLLLQFQAPLLFVYGQWLRFGAAPWPGSARWAALLEDPDRLQAWLAGLLADGGRR